MRGVLSRKVWTIFAACAGSVLLFGREACPGDARAIQEEIDRTANQGGGTVHIAPGRYVLRAALTLRSKVRVIGTPGSTVLASSHGAKALLARDAGHNTDQIVLAEDADFRVGDGVAIRDARSPSAFAVTTATLAERTSPKTFRLSAPLVQDYAVARGATVARAFPVMGGWNIQDATVEGITIDGNRQKAEALDGCRGAGIYLYACQHVTVRNCTVRNYHGDGISFQWGSRDVTVEDCLVEDCAVFGLHPGSDSHHSVVRRNRSLANGGPGIFVCESVKHVAFEKNELRGNHGPGISIGCRDTDNVFRENTIVANGRTGILFRDDGGEAKGAHRNVFEKNRVLDNGSSSQGDPPPAAVTILGSHRDLVFRKNTLGNAERGGPAGTGILVLGDAQGLRSEANRFLNLTTDVDLGTARAPAKPAADPRGEQFLPLGVYWAGEFTFQECEFPETRWRRIDAALDDLALHHVNAIWLTHLSASETAEFARRAACRGICLVASIAELAGEVSHIRAGAHQALISRTLQA